MDLDQHLAKLPRRAIPSDLERILALPRVVSSGSPELAEKWTRELSTGGVLRPIQGAALETISLFGGAFCSMNVGSGKTLVALLAAGAANAKNPLIIVPPALVQQMEKEAETWAEFFRFTPPKILSYGILSTQTDILDRIKPDLIIADEAHYLRHKTSARTRRFLRYFHNSRCSFVALSGTITSKSLLDYAHLLELALRERTPIPLNRYELERWAACIDPDGEPNQSDLNRLAYLVRWSSQHKLTPANRESIRRAFRERLTTTPGVVSTRRGSCDASLYLIKHRPPHSGAVSRALKTLRDKWETPDGEPLADASTKSRAFKNLSTGFFYRWDWGPGGEDLEWLEARRDLNRRVSKILRYSPREGRDSPKLVMDWSRNGGGNNELRRAVRLWDEIKHRANPQPSPVWICTEKIQFVIDWIYDLTDPAIVWYSSRAVELALASVGLETHGAGSLPPTPDKTRAASIAVHGKGRNLQAFSRCFVVEPPANGATWEQLIGRNHRAGFTGDAAWWEFFDFGDAVKRAKTHAEYIQETQGTPQKLNVATFLTTGDSPKTRKGK